MTVKASAAGALMLAAGLFVSIAGPSPATAAGSESAAASKSESATSGKSAKSSSRYLEKKRYVYRKFTRTASKSAETGKAAEKDVADASAGVRPAMTESIANANAQMNSADAAQDSTGDNAKAMSQAMSAKANTILLAAADNQADGQAPAEGAAVTAPDQLNDLDRALQENPSTQTVAMAQAKPAQQENPDQASSNDSLDKTSLIGKIFIAFGTLLTMASAARMFMA
ncbi:MAG TPA: hypothetical protein VFP38_11955 [Bradyrhizobium sp.]|jgi:hypothetical protein|nr:hypothetical protein [Bradyrhizobium sp.]